MCINFYSIRYKLYTLVHIATWCVLGYKTDCLKAETNLLKSSLVWKVPILGGGNDSLWKYPLIIITSQNGTLTQPIGKWRVTSNIHKK